VPDRRGVMGILLAAHRSHGVRGAAQCIGKCSLRPIFCMKQLAQLDCRVWGTWRAASGGASILHRVTNRCSSCRRCARRCLSRFLSDAQETSTYVLTTVIGFNEASMGVCHEVVILLAISMSVQRAPRTTTTTMFRELQAVHF